MLKLIPIAVILIYFLRGVATYLQDYLMNYVGENIVRNIRDELYARIQDLPMLIEHFVRHFNIKFGKEITGTDIGTEQWPLVREFAAVAHPSVDWSAGRVRASACRFSRCLSPLRNTARHCWGL